MVVDRGPNGGGNILEIFKGGGEINFPRQFHSCRPRMEGSLYSSGFLFSILHLEKLQV